MKCMCDISSVADCLDPSWQRAETPISVLLDPD